MKRINILSLALALSLLGGVSAAQARDNGYNAYLNNLAQQAVLNRAAEASQADAYQRYLWDTGHDPNLYTAIPGVGVVPKSQAGAYYGYGNTYGSPYYGNPYYNYSNSYGTVVNPFWGRHHRR